MDSSIRKTRRRYESIGHCRFLTFSCYQRFALFNNDAIKIAFLDQLTTARRTTHFKLAGYVIMPEHVHLMVMPDLPQWPVSRVLRYLKGPFAHRVIERWKHLDAPILSRLRDHRGALHFWQVGGGYDRNIVSAEEYEEKINYMHANPVTRGLAAAAVDWRWSSACWYEGLRDGALAVDAVA